jgi:phosphoenolpyruvate synthase/pyruvate phosphate dikinase
MEGKRVYFFGNHEAEGDGARKELLGGKGANPAEMDCIGIPVPPGFTITTPAASTTSPEPAIPAALRAPRSTRRSPASRR